MKKILPIACACATVGSWHSNVAAVARETRDRKEREPRIHSSSEPGVQFVVSSKRRTTRDPVNYPGAYEEGYV